MSGIVPKEVAAIMGVIDTHCRYKSVNESPRNYRIYHPSALGGCLRLMQYQRFADDPSIEGIELTSEPLESNTMRLFDTGHSMHARWAKYWEEIGVLRGIWECNNRLCRAFDDDGNFLGIDRAKEIREKYKEVATEDSDYLHNLPEDKRKEEAKLRSSIFPRKKGYENKIGIFKPKKCNCGCEEFTYHEINVRDEELNVFGHADLILDFSNFDVDKYSSHGEHNSNANIVDRTFDPKDLPSSPIVVDMKSINDRGFKNLKENGPSLKYKVQLVSYCNILDLEYGIIIYENKNDSQTMSFKISRSEDREWPMIHKQIRLMNKMYESKLLPPPRPLRKDSYDCKYCDFKNVCHNSKIWNDPDLNEKRIKFYDTLI